MKLTVGMPVFERAWCLPLWFDCLEAQNLAPKEDITLCFAYSKSYDGTYDIIRRRGEEYGNVLIYEYDLKTWSDRNNLDRFHTLAQLRNALLDMVKETDADYFLSWDNDIIFPPDTLYSMFEMCSSTSAIGALIDMGGRDAHMSHPSIMSFENGPGETAWRKPWSEYSANRNTLGKIKADVIMAVKLMGKEVYQNSRYRWDPIGEDIGWSRDCHERGYTRFLDIKAHGIHLYDKDLVIRKMKDHPKLCYPELYEPLKEWYVGVPEIEAR